MADFLHAHAKRATGKALLCTLVDGADHWVPLSQLAQDSEVRKLNDRGVLRTSDWWANAAHVAHLVGQITVARRPPNHDIDAALPASGVCPACGQRLPADNAMSAGR